MDYDKIGNFILEQRKSKKLTQAKLAEKLFVSEKTVSKWENGKGIPDTNILPKLCEILGVGINELLNGEKIATENYENKAESTLLELQTAKQKSDKRLLCVEIVICVVSLLFFLTIMFSSIMLCKQGYVAIGITTMVIGFIVFIVAMSFAIYIEQVAGFYVCKHCNHKYVPNYFQVYMAMHNGRTRFMKCPKCKKWSWNKKTIK